MSSLIEFEIKKFFNRRKNLLVLAIFIVLSVIFITLNYRLNKQLEKSEITSIDLQIDSIEDALNNIENEIIRLPDNEKLKKIKSSYEQELNLLTDIRKAYINNDFNKYLESKIQLDKNLLINIKSGDIISPYDPKEIEQRIEVNTILYEEGIKPIYTSVSMEGFNFIKLFLNNPISIIIVILIIVLSGDVVSSEFDSNTYKLLFTQPISKKRILLSKILTTLIMVNIILFGIIAICFCVLGFINGFGSINYPVQFYNNGIVEYISIGKFILFEFILFIILTIFICILAVAISSFSKSTSNSISISIIITVSAYMMSNRGVFSESAHLNPFIYFDISNILQGGIANLYGNENVNFKYGVLTLGLSIILLVIVNIFLFEKNNINFNKRIKFIYKTK